jgi:hypothetical protein
MPSAPRGGRGCVASPTTATCDCMVMMPAAPDWHGATGAQGRAPGHLDGFGEDELTHWVKTDVAILLPELLVISMRMALATP